MIPLRVRAMILFGACLFMASCELRNSFSTDVVYTRGDSTFARASALMLRYQCFDCHAWSSYSSDSDYLADHEVSRNVIPGNGAASNFYKLIRGQGDEGGGVMPPSGPMMTEEEALVIKQWIDEM